MTDATFTLSQPVRILFGPGRLKELGQVVAELGSVAFVVMGEHHAEDSGLRLQVEKSLRESRVEAHIYFGTPPNPGLDTVMQAIEQARKHSPDVIVGVGGGSVMDVAKAVALGLTHSGKLWEYRIQGSLSIGAIEKTLPVVTVPTTAGSASEVSPAALITHDNRKEVIVSQHMFPATAIVDPSLTISLSEYATAVAGYDCFVQGLEPLVATNANILSVGFAREAIRLVASNLRAVVHDTNDLNSRCGMSLASILGGFAISQSGVGAIHALGAPLASGLGLAHGESLVPVTIPVLEYNSGAAAAEYDWVAREISAGSERDIVRAAIGLIQDIGLQGLLSLRVSSSDLERFVVDAQNPDLGTNPVAMGPEEIRKIYQIVGAGE